jgi:Fic family protein
MSNSLISQETVVLETPASMEPMLLDEITPELADEAAAIVGEVLRLGANLPDQTLSSLASLVRLMNCYYSNLIEGHKTRPHDIDRALREDGEKGSANLPGDPTGERLLKLALAHIDCQLWIDHLHIRGQLPDPASVEFICEVHRRFYSELPQEFLEIRDDRNGEIKRNMVAGQTRGQGEEVAVGHHIAPLGGSVVSAFMNEYAARYSALRHPQIGKAQRLYGIAAAHHRLLYIHPFDDGNGRVARLISHAMMLDAGLGACGLWSMSRGLARGLRDDAPRVPPFLRQFGGRSEVEQYKLMMAHADMPRMGDLDGRGNLSRKRLQEFCDWFLAVALDQLTFMRTHFGLNEIGRRLVNQYVPHDKSNQKPT